MTAQQFIEAFQLAVSMRDWEAALELVRQMQEAGLNTHLLRKVLAN